MNWQQNQNVSTRKREKSITWIYYYEIFKRYGFHFLSIMHTWTDFATFGAIEQHVIWIFSAFTGRCPGFTMFVLIPAS